MKPVDQEFVHKPEEGQFGDCQRAVIASLLGLSISDVPHFLQEADGDAALFWEGIQTFLSQRGLAYLTVPAASGIAFYGLYDGVHHEISGPSPRGNGTYHAVVGCDGEIVHDPHPSRAGLAGDPSEWTYSYLVKRGAK